MPLSRNSAKAVSRQGIRQPKQYSLEFAAEGEQGRHVPDNDTWNHWGTDDPRSLPFAFTSFEVRHDLQLFT